MRARDTRVTIGPDMTAPLDPNQHIERDRERRIKEAAEDAAQEELGAAENRVIGLLATLEMRLKESGAWRTRDELVSELGPDRDPDDVDRALDLGVERGTVTKSEGRYGAVQN